MMNFFKAALAILGFAVPAFATELDIPVFSGGYGTAFYEETARLFEAQRPGVTVKLYGDPRIEDKLRIRIIDGDYPDATLTPRLLWPTLIRAGKVLDLRPYLAEPNWEGDARWADTFLPGALASWRIDEGVYGVPFGYACWTLFYNRSLFRAQGWEVPHTWEEFFVLCDRIQATGLAPVSLTGLYGNYPDAFLRAAYYSLAGAEGWRALNAIAPGARSDPRYVRAAEILQRITQHYTLRGWEGSTHTAAQLAFFESRAAMTVSGSWMLHEMAGKIPADFDMGAMNFPVFADGIADPSAIQTGADCFFVFATGNPARERLTVDFLRFLTSRARAEAFVRQLDSPIAVRGVPFDAFSPRLRETAALIAVARESFNMPQVVLQSPALRQTLVDARIDLMSGRLTPQAFGERVEAAAARDRARIAEPDHVEIRHPIAGTGLLVLLAVAGIGFAWKKITALGSRRSEADVRREGYFGSLRTTVGLGFVGPAFLLYSAFILAPGLVAFGWAFTHWDGLGPRIWNGTFNFKWLLFESDVFWLALKNNLYLMLVPALVVVPLALLLATLIHRGVWGANGFRAVFLFPNLLGGVAATLLWLNAYEPHGGLINATLVALGRLLGSEWLLGFDGYPWLAPAHLYAALIPIYLWMACGFNLILYLAAMEGVDTQLYEAAELDGATPWQQFFAITLPLIWEVVTISAVFIVIAGLNAFELIWLLTSQDPDSASHTLGTLMVTTMFKEFEIGRATAIAVVLLTLVLAVSAAVMRLLKREAVE